MRSAAPRAASRSDRDRTVAEVSDDGFGAPAREHSGESSVPAGLRAGWSGVRAAWRTLRARWSVLPSVWSTLPLVWRALRVDSCMVQSGWRALRLSWTRANWVSEGAASRDVGKS